MAQLVEGSQSDIRLVINMLSTWKLSKASMDFDEGKALYVVMRPVVRILSAQTDRLVHGIAQLGCESEIRYADAMDSVRRPIEPGHVPSQQQKDSERQDRPVLPRSLYPAPNGPSALIVFSAGKALPMLSSSHKLLPLGKLSQEQACPGPERVRAAAKPQAN